ncbi:hypothetical protein [Chryseobacterium echinoideorum]|uniref:hypothetical protein n=1 Tax=Chryseobacterium echinoideorum TaxID=1549648 RepID=UPI001186F6F0|nr:hypothetical protein [Chryseobacterium echinoideorum]
MGGHPNVTCEFRKKVVEISKRQNFDPNDLMSVMKVETSGTFSPSKIEIKPTKEKRKDGTFKRDYRGLTKDEIMQLPENFAGAVGLIQFTPVAISSLNTSYNFSLTKRKLALMSALDQLDYVEKYIELWKKTKNITSRISISDLYVLVFAPNYFGSSDDTTLYREGSDYYNANSSVDTDGKNGITKKEIAARAISAKTEGFVNNEVTFECGNNGQADIQINAKDIVTYHIYENGRIEKHIPKTIKEEYKQKYKYVYHDKDKNEHEICIVDWFTVDRRNNGQRISTIPAGYINTYSYPSGGNAQTAYLYSNGDICVSGTRYGYRKYSKGQGKVPLVRMMDSLSYEKGYIKIFYTFQNSQRRYCNPDAYAGFIGALAKLGREDVLCTGMCFADATSYPSVTHPNGDCADTAYYATLELEQKKVNAFKEFHFEKIYRGSGSWYSRLVGTIYSSGHEDHLHSGEFNSNIIQTIEEK